MHPEDYAVVMHLMSEDAKTPNVKLSSDAEVAQHLQQIVTNLTP